MNIPLRRVDAPTDISELCCCLQYAGDNPLCPVHYPKQSRLTTLASTYAANPNQEEAVSEMAELPAMGDYPNELLNVTEEEDARLSRPYPY